MKPETGKVYWGDRISRAKVDFLSLDPEINFEKFFFLILLVCLISEKASINYVINILSLQSFITKINFIFMEFDYQKFHYNSLEKLYKRNLAYKKASKNSKIHYYII